jgi:hypothetical protein
LPDAGVSTGQAITLDVDVAEPDMSVRVRVPALPTDGAMVHKLLLRFADVDNTYQAWLVYRLDNTTEARIYRIEGGVENELARTEPLFGFAADDVWYLRARATNGRLQVKFWEASHPEPGGWFLTVQDDVFASGRVGVEARRFTGNTQDNIEFPFAELRLHNPQRMQVERSINTVQKAHPAGTPVRLWHTPVVGL